MWTWYIELTGQVKSGTSPVLELNIQWADEVQEQAEKTAKNRQTFVLGQQ
jgi:hypothetical protein